MFGRPQRLPPLLPPSSPRHALGQPTASGLVAPPCRPPPLPDPRSLFSRHRIYPASRPLSFSVISPIVSASSPPVSPPTGQTRTLCQLTLPSSSVCKVPAGLHRSPSPPLRQVAVCAPQLTICAPFLAICVPVLAQKRAFPRSVPRPENIRIYPQLRCLPAETLPAAGARMRRRCFVPFADFRLARWQIYLQGHSYALDASLCLGPSHPVH